MISDNPIWINLIKKRILYSTCNQLKVEGVVEEISPSRRHVKISGVWYDVGIPNDNIDNLRREKTYLTLAVRLDEVLGD